MTGEEAVVCHDGTTMVHAGWLLAGKGIIKHDPAWKLITSEPPKLKGRKPGRKPNR